MENLSGNGFSDEPVAEEMAQKSERRCSADSKNQVANLLLKNMEAIERLTKISQDLADSESHLKDQLSVEIENLKAISLAESEKLGQIKTIDDLLSERRSIRKWKNDPISNDVLESIIDAARLAPSASNSQPWLFKIVDNPEIKQQLAELIFNQTFAAKAPALIVCCANVEKYLESTIKGARELENSGYAENHVVEAVIDRNKSFEDAAAVNDDDYEKYALRIASNVFVASQNIQLKAHDYGLGSCWLGALGNTNINELFGWGNEKYPVGVIAIGYPDEEPEARPRHNLDEIIIKD